jgi:glutamate synthase (NADPH/NADH) small chain
MSENNIYFEEEPAVDFDFTMEEAITEAARCLYCKKPFCTEACPISNDIPLFNKAIASGNFGEAADIIAVHSNLPAICGRVCPREKQCEGACVLSRKGKHIEIGKLERFVADFCMDNHIKKVKRVTKVNGHVAVIGAGPAGLSVAHDLIELGYGVIVYDANQEGGGVMMYGIPSFRLHKNIIRREIEALKERGVQFVFDTSIGKDKMLADLRSEYDAVFIGMGTHFPQPLPLAGDVLPGMIEASAFLTLVQQVQNGRADFADIPVKQGDHVIVIGAGNVAIDAVRTAQRLTGEAKIVYRRGKINMKCLPSEYEEALADGVTFQFYSAPKGVVGKDKVEGLRYERQEVLEDATMVPTGEYSVVPADKIIVAIGNQPDKNVLQGMEGLALNKWNYIITKESPYYGMTSLDGVFAAGDIVHEPATIVKAMKYAKLVALGISSYLKNKIS